MSPDTLAPISTKERVLQIMSPAGGSSPPKNLPSTAKAVPERGTSTKETKTDRKPRIEIQVARTISVSKGKRQVLVPVGARVDQLSNQERLVVKRPMTPVITDANYRRRYAVSQELQIESI